MDADATSILRNHAPRHGATAKRYISPQPTPLPPSPRRQRRNGATGSQQSPPRQHQTTGTPRRGVTSINRLAAPTPRVDTCPEHTNGTPHPLKEG